MPVTNNSLSTDTNTETPIGQDIKKHSVTQASTNPSVYVFDVSMCLQDVNTKVLFPSFWQELRQMALRKWLKFKSIEQSWNGSSAAAQPGDNEQKSIMKQVLSKQ